MQDSTIYDTRGCTAYTTQSVYTANGYEQFAWTSSTFDEQRRQLSFRKSNNELTEYTWNCCAKASETLPDGTQYTYVYDALKRLISKTQVGIGNQPNLVTTYAYDAANRRLSETITGGELSTAATWEYNLAGQLIKSVDHQGLITTYAYIQGRNTGSSLKGRVVTAIMPGGFTINNDSFCDGQQSAITGTAQVAQYYDYGVNPDGTIWKRVYIGGGDSPRWRQEVISPLLNVIRIEKPGFGDTVTEEYFYNLKNQIVKSLHSGMAAMLYEYDELGTVIREGLDINDNGALDLASADVIMRRHIEYEKIDSYWWLKQTNSSYTATGSDIATIISIDRNRLSGFPASVVSEQSSIDIYGNMTTRKQLIDRNAKQMIVEKQSPKSPVMQQETTINSLLVSQRDSSNLTTTYGYDGLHRMITVTEPRIGTTTITYHTATGKIGLKASVANAAGNITTYDYDATSGRLLWEKNALNQYTRYSYNRFGQQTKVWGDAQYPVEFGYDNYGQRVTMKTFRSGTAWNNTDWPTDVVGDLTTWIYDLATGLVTSKMDAAGKSVTYAYSVDGKLTQRTWARGIVTDYSYDPATGRLLKVDYANATPDITYTYTRLGQLATVQDATGTRNFSYNAQITLTNETINGIYNKAITRGYTSTGMKGKPLSMAINGVNNYTYGYDDYGRLNAIITAAGTFSYTHLADSDLVSQMTRPNGVTTAWNFEPHRNLVAQMNNGNQSIFMYTNDAIGNRTAITRSGTAFAVPDSINYSYNDRSEVTNVASTANNNYQYIYNFDPIGNRLAVTLSESAITYSVNSLNQYSQIDDNSSSFDTDGNMLTYENWILSWDAENRLVQAVKDSKKIQFSYDYMGRRIEKKEYNAGELIKYTKFVYSDFKLIEELDALNANAILRHYTWQSNRAGLDTPLSVLDVPQSKTYFYLIGNNKNVSELTDIQGNIVAHYEYSPFGIQTTIAGVYAEENPLRFSSEVYDSETDLVYYNYRYYSAILGRWLNRDLIEEQGGPNLYAMVRNNPICKWDYLGLACCGKVKYDASTQCCTVGDIIQEKYEICVMADPDHAWITATNLHSGESHTYGRWKQGVRDNGNVKVTTSGVMIDAEAKRCPRSDTKRRCTTTCGYNPTIDDGYGFDPSSFNPINWIASWVGGPEAAGARYNNCASYALSEWNRVVGYEDMNASDFGGFAETPSGLMKCIERRNNPPPPPRWMTDPNALKVL